MRFVWFGLNSEDPEITFIFLPFLLPEASNGMIFLKSVKQLFTLYIVVYDEYQIPSVTVVFEGKQVVGLERGPLSLVSTTEELLDRKVAAAV
jgi:hypothetical protein